MSENSKKNLDGKVSVGKVRDSHGLKGELFIMTNLDKQPEWVNKITDFYLQFQSPTEEGKHLPQVMHFAIKKVRPHKKGFIVKSDEIVDRNQSDSYKGALFYIDEKFLSSEKGDKIYLREIKDFEVTDKETTLGQIIGFSSNNAQDLLVIEYQGKKIEVPFVENFIVKIDYDKKTILMDLPEGLY